ncbi:hypothetical protein IJG72_06355 [bacterium]|nr:hypothetical protein [bacterium]
MSTTKQLKVYKGLPTIIKSRARGYYDDKTILTFNTDAESQNITMDVYDGLSYDIASSASGVKVLNFVNTVLPYKWDYSTALSTNRYCFAPVLENMYYVDCYKYNNFTKVGSPTVDEDTGLVSNFSTSNYLQLRNAFNPANNPWEVQVKFTTSSNVTTVQEILHSRKGTGSSGRYGIGLSIDNTHFNFFCSSDGSDWLFDLYGTYTILTNTTYWVKIGWDGTEYYLEYSLNGETYTRDITNASTSGVYSPLTSSFIGVWNNGSFTNAFGGSIDLSETYIKVDNSL